MNTCRLCDTESDELTDIDLGKEHGVIGVCQNCIREAIAKELSAIKDAHRLYCQNCRHWTVDGYCLSGLTPDRCC